MNDVLRTEYKQAKETLSEKQKKIVKIIIAKETQIQKTQDEIQRLLQENDLNIFDIDKYKHDENIERFMKMKIPG
jgi:hypothetical protein